MNDLLFVPHFTPFSSASKIQSRKMIRLTRMMQFIEQNYAKDITRDRIMREGMTSNAVGTRIFRELLGKTPAEYLNSYPDSTRRGTSEGSGQKCFRRCL